MATEVGVVYAVEQFRAADDALPGEGLSTTPTALKRCIVYVTNNSQAMTAGDTLSTEIVAAIQNLLKNGKTIVPRSVALHGNAYDGTTFFGAKSIAFTTPNLTFIPTANDYVTNQAMTVNVPLIRQFSFFVSYSDY